MRKFLVPACLLLVALTFIIIAPPAYAATISIPPSADVYVSVANPLRNYGSEKSLNIDMSPVTSSYLKFTVADLTNVPTKAALTLRNAKSSQARRRRTDARAYSSHPTD